MKLSSYKIIFVTVGLVGVLLIASLQLIPLVKIKNSAPYSELYILNSNGMAEGYPFDIVTGTNYTLDVGVTNHLSTSAYYVLYIKLQNKTDVPSFMFTRTPDSLDASYEYRFVLADNQTWMQPMSFSFAGTVNPHYAIVDNLRINSANLAVDKPAVFDTSGLGYYYYLSFELWSYNSTTQQVGFTNTFTYLRLNFTGTVSS